MAFVDGFIQVAPDSTGKRVRNVAVDVLQPDGTTAQVYQQMVTRAAFDGTVLDTMGWVETERDKYMRNLAEETLSAIQALAAIFGGPFTEPTPPTVALGE